MKQRFTLPEEIYLAAFDLPKDRLSERRWLDYLVQGAALAELLWGGTLGESGGQVEVSVGAQPSDPLLAAVVARLGRTNPRGWKALLHDGKVTLRAVEDRLCERGIIAREGRRIEVVDRRGVALLQARLQEHLRDDADLVAAEPGDAILLVVASILPIRTIFSRHNKARDEGRLDRISSRLVERDPAYGSLIKQMRHTRGASFSAGGPVH